MPRPPHARLCAAGLIALMLIAALMIWIGIPLLWLLIGSQLVSTTQPSFGPYMVVLAGIIVSVALVAMAIGRLNRAYQRVTGTDGTVRVQLPWLRSMRAERHAPTAHSVLDVVMVSSVVLAAAIATVWFFGFAGSSIG